MKRTIKRRQPNRRIERVPLYRQELTKAYIKAGRQYGRRMALLRQIWSKKNRDRIISDVATEIYRKSEHVPKSKEPALIQLRQELRRLSIEMDQMERKWVYLTIERDQVLKEYTVREKPLRKPLDEKPSPWEVALKRIEDLVLSKSQSSKTLEKRILDLRRLLSAAEALRKPILHKEANHRAIRTERIERINAAA